MRKSGTTAGGERRAPGNGMDVAAGDVRQRTVVLDPNYAPGKAWFRKKIVRPSESSAEARARRAPGWLPAGECTR